jgi:predicted nucleotidyltransferase
VSYGWPDAPRDIREQIEGLASGLAEIAGDELVGVYLHGSLALGCFNPELSDVDILGVASRPLELDEKRRAVALLAETSGRPGSVEFHQLALPDVIPWRYPVAVDFHYGDVWRNDLLSDLGATLERQHDSDADLAAHIFVTRARGVVLEGQSPQSVFPAVPWVDYVDALLRDLEWSFESDRSNSVYRVLSPARIWAALATGELQSKETGAVWALERLPEDLRPLLVDALARYRGETAAFEADDERLSRYRAFVEAEVRQLASR